MSTRKLEPYPRTFLFFEKSARLKISSFTLYSGNSIMCKLKTRDITPCLFGTFRLIFVILLETHLFENVFRQWVFSCYHFQNFNSVIYNFLRYSLDDSHKSLVLLFSEHQFHVVCDLFFTSTIKIPTVFVSLVPLSRVNTANIVFY